jgi:hypothetical protein
MTASCDFEWAPYIHGAQPFRWRLDYSRRFFILEKCEYLANPPKGGRRKALGSKGRQTPMTASCDFRMGAGISMGRSHSDGGWTTAAAFYTKQLNTWQTRRKAATQSFRV